MHRIFIVEDDAVIADVVERHLSGWGYQVRQCQDFEHVLEAFAAFDPQLVILDISLPFFNGYHWCRSIRQVSKVPILFLSSASDNMNIVMAVQMGGDDFVAKPFDLSVLTAKVQALLRRTYDFGPAAPLLECGGAVLNLSDASLTVGQARVELTKNEFRILRLLMEHRGEIVSREAIMTCLWESDSFVDDNTLAVNINRLRKKLAGAGLADFIRTRKGAGYQVEG
jgi:two-component system response regulator protein BraR/BceR